MKLEVGLVNRVLIKFYIDSNSIMLAASCEGKRHVEMSHWRKFVDSRLLSLYSLDNPSRMAYSVALLLDNTDLGHTRLKIVIAHSEAISKSCVSCEN